MPFLTLQRCRIFQNEEIFLRYSANVDQDHTFGPYPPVTTFVRVPPEIGRKEIQTSREINP